MRGSLIWVFLMCYIFGHIINHNNGIVKAKSFSKLEDPEIEKKLKTMNKPAVKIIKTIDGDQYGCVDFFKQPAFDHPSMKNHTYHYNMRPTWYPEGMGGKMTNNSKRGFGHLWENGVGCPIGTVPIQRISKDDLLRLKSFNNSYEPRSSLNDTTYDMINAANSRQRHFAVARTKNIGMTYNGATMELKVVAPQVKPGQFSSSRLHFHMGKDFISTGFMVNPMLYKDDQLRSFVSTRVGGKHCFNHDCDIGMISIRPDFPMGHVMRPLSVRDKTSFYSLFGLFKDKEKGEWWLQYDNNAEEVGFWPSHLFAASSGTHVEWGGEVFSGSKPSPQMGFGYFPVGNIYSDQYARRLTIVDSNNNVDRNLYHVITSVDDVRGYNAFTRLERWNNGNGRIVYYGGPGNI